MSHDDVENIGSNPTDNPHLSDVVQRGLSRRTVMQGGLTALALGFFGGASGLGAGSAFAAPKPAAGAGAASPLLGFTAVPPSFFDTFVVPTGYSAQVLIPWGTPLRPNGPAWRKDASNTAAEQEQQVGSHHDGMHFFPLKEGPQANRRGLLVLNHEYINPTLHYTDGDAVITKAKVDKALAGHGVTVIEVADAGGGWKPSGGRLNRRITGASPVTFSGPVTMAHPALETGSAPLGTLNNCSHGYTPWGTYLACEENFNGYFGTEDKTFTPTPDQARYGIRKEPATLPAATASNPKATRPNPVGGTVQSFGYKWHPVDARFDLAKNPNELNRFGWVVEIDPFDTSSVPVKRTALGRFKHESATVTEAKGGQVVVYSGDDENRDYVYKYVSNAPWRTIINAGKSPLDEGTLYVAKFADDLTGTWLPLTKDNKKLSGFVDQADIALRTRQAADAVGATRLDRPEWVAVNERNKDVYLTLTNGSTGVGAVNPRNPNPYGSIVRWREAGADSAALSFAWDIFLLAGDPTVDPNTTVSDEDRFGSPDGIWADPDGRIWIQTDISNSVQRLNAEIKNSSGEVIGQSGYKHIGNNMMLVADPVTKEVKRFLTGPNGCEITGCITTPDQKTMFVNVQHPGESTPASGGTPTPANPRLVSNWPDFDPEGRPRSATVVITKDDGGVIGT